LEGIVAKHAQSLYRELPRAWVKVINTDCSQLRDCHDLFERRTVLRATLRTPRPDAAIEAPRAAGTRNVERKRRSPARATLKAERVGSSARRKKAR